MFPEISDPKPFLGIKGNKKVRIIDMKGMFDNQESKVELESFSRLEKILQEVGVVNKILVVLNGKTTRFDIFSEMLFKRLAELFAKDAWKIIDIVVTHWSYDKYEIKRRNLSGPSEEEYKSRMKAILNKSFNQNVDKINFIFMDSIDSYFA